MAHLLALFMAMPFLGVRIGIPMLSGKGNTTPPVTSGDGHVDFSRNPAIDSALLAIFEDI